MKTIKLKLGDEPFHYLLGSLFSFEDIYLFDLIFLLKYKSFPKTKANFGFCYQLLMKMSRFKEKIDKKI